MLASRLSDLEHKGNTYKQLKTLRRASVLFDAKVVCGLLFVAAISIGQISFLLILGYCHHYTGNPDIHYYITALVLNFACCFSLYLLQLDLSLLFFNQMIPLVAGLCGSLLGLILMYIKMYSFLPWGGNLSTALVRIEWNQDTGISSYFYRVFSPVETAAVVCVFLWIIIFYLAGRILFTRREA